MRFRFGLIVAILICGLVCSGCLFEPRDAAEPGGVAINYLPAADPVKVLVNLGLALGGGDPSGYERMLAEDFMYVPDGSAEANYPGVDWTGWGLEQEVAFVNSFLNNVDGVTADMQAEEIFGWGGSGNEAELIYVYAVEVAESGGETPYRARARLEFRIEATEWRLVRWIDEQGENDPDTGGLLPSLGQRRGAFAASGGR